MIVKKEKLFKFGMMLSIIPLITSIDYCNAATINFGTVGDSSGSGPSEIPFKEWIAHDSGDKRYEYTYKEVITSNTSISIDGYNLKGEPVMPSTTIITEKFKAGTWIGINITELQTAGWTLTDFKYREVQKKYTCTYTKAASSEPCPKTASGSKTYCDGLGGTFSGVYPGATFYGTCSYWGNCPIPADTKEETYTKEYNEEFSCPSIGGGYELTDSKTEDVPLHETTHSEISSTAESQAIASAQNAASSLVGASVGNVNYINNNKYPESISELDYDTIRATKVGELQIIGGGTKTGSVTQRYEYKQEKVCMNLKNSLVTYGTECNESKGEIQIQNECIPGVACEPYPSLNEGKPKYWHYFIPLNTKTSDEAFFLQISSNAERELNVDECKDAMTRYATNYKDYIVPNAEAISGETNLFTGTYEDDIRIIEENQKCYFSTTIRIPIVQKFYNEFDSGDNDLKFKGFNFYYKPIDITNPFPNGISSNSVWNEWHNNDTKEPDLTESFSEITYKAVNIDTNKVRQYNKKSDCGEHGNDKCSYTDWIKSMNVDGSSSFIDSEGIVQRFDNNFYKLGCGPLNVNPLLENGEDNYLYRSWCSS